MDQNTLILTATDGEEIRLMPNSSGTEGTHAICVNGWNEGIEHFDKHGDGNTVIPCSPDRIGAMSPADAYQEFFRRMDEESIDMIVHGMNAGFYEMAQVELDYAHRPYVLKVLGEQMGWVEPNPGNLTYSAFRSLPTIVGPVSAADINGCLDVVNG